MLKHILLVTMSLAAGAAMADGEQSQKYPHGLDYNRAVSFAASAEDARNHYRVDADSRSDEFVQRAASFDDSSNHSYTCTIYANLLYRTAFGDKSLDAKTKIFDTTEQNGENASCHSSFTGSVKYGS